MKRRWRVLVIMASVIAMVLAFNVGAASAGHTGAPTLWECNGDYDGAFGNCEPENVINKGSAVKEQTFGPILLGPAGQVAAIEGRGQFRGIDRNPFCLIHGAP